MTKRATTTITVAGLQCALSDDASKNVKRVEELVRQAHGKGARIILPSELFEGHYFCRHQSDVEFARARPAKDHPTLAHFQNLAKELEVVIPVSFFERAGQIFYNSIAIIDADGTQLGVYRKSHIPDGPGYQEKFYFRPGDTGFRAWKTRYATIGVAICWDQWFPEAARSMVLDGAQILFYPTAIGTEPAAPDVDTKDPWQRVMIGHAVANSCPVVAANRIGKEPDQTFYGHSFICNQRGDVLSELGRKEEGAVIAEIDLEEVERYRNGFGLFRDRRPELYQPLLRSSQ
jgi:N-carbamoylputrescine amidase